MTTRANRLRQLLAQPEILVMPGCHDTLSAKLIEHGKTPVLPPAELAAIGYKIAVYPLTQLSVAIKAMRAALEAIKAGSKPEVMDFEDLKTVVGFPEYYAAEDRYRY